MSTLSLQCGTVLSVNLYPLLGLTELKRLHLQGEVLGDCGRPIVKPYTGLCYLPSALQTLDLDTVFVDPAGFNKINCTVLANVRINRPQNEDRDIAELLSYLPALKV